LGLLGDTHYTNRSPERRLDNYWETQIKKTEQALSIFRDNNCHTIIQTGDFCDTPTVANRVISTLISLFCGRDLEVCTIAGQHDMTGHSLSTLPNSPLAVLEAADVVRILDNNCFSLGAVASNIPLVHIYGASFGEEVPKVENKKWYNILVIHKMIGDRPLYPGQELIGPNQFLRNNPDYNLVVCGDYHYRFISSYQGRTIINPGALVRKSISKFDLEHKPAVIIFDTETSESKVIELDVEPIEKVFNLKRVEKKDSDILIQFIEGLKNRGKGVVGWKHILQKVFKEKNSNIEVKNIIDECLEEVEKKS